MVNVIPKIVIVNAPSDNSIADKLDSATKVLQRTKKATIVRNPFSSFDIDAFGDVDMVIVIISENFVNSDLYDDVESVVNSERDVIITPLKVTELGGYSEMYLSKLEPLPRKHLHNGKIWDWISDWDNVDSAWTSVARGVLEYCKDLKLTAQANEEAIKQNVPSEELEAFIRHYKYIDRYWRKIENSQMKKLEIW